MDSPSSGPWRYYLRGDGTRFVVTTAKVGPGSCARDDICTLAPDCEANARLIAAAPDLLLALRECVIPRDSGPVFSQDLAVLMRALAALSKATIWTHPDEGCSHAEDE